MLPLFTVRNYAGDATLIIAFIDYGINPADNSCVGGILQYKMAYSYSWKGLVAE